MLKGNFFRTSYTVTWSCVLIWGLCRSPKFPVFPHLLPPNPPWSVGSSTSATPTQTRPICSHLRRMRSAVPSRIASAKCCQKWHLRGFSPTQSTYGGDPAGDHGPQAPTCRPPLPRERTAEGRSPMPFGLQNKDRLHFPSSTSVSGR